MAFAASGGGPSSSSHLDAYSTTVVRAIHLSATLRPSYLRLSTPVNQRLVPAPSKRRSPSRRSLLLRNTHEQDVGIVQPSRGMLGALRSRYRLPATCLEASHQSTLGEISTARNSDSMLGRLRAAGFKPLASGLRLSLPSRFSSTFIMTTPPVKTAIETLPQD